METATAVRIRSAPASRFTGRSPAANTVPVSWLRFGELVPVIVRVTQPSANVAGVALIQLVPSYQRTLCVSGARPHCFTVIELNSLPSATLTSNRSGVPSTGVSVLTGIESY